MRVRSAGHGGMVAWWAGTSISCPACAASRSCLPLYPCAPCAGGGGLPVPAGGADQRQAQRGHQRLRLRHPDWRRRRHWWGGGGPRDNAASPACVHMHGTGRKSCCQLAACNAAGVPAPPAGPYQLSNAEAEHFQRGQLDVFEVEGAPDAGRLQQIEVRWWCWLAGWQSQAQVAGLLSVPACPPASARSSCAPIPACPPPAGAARRRGARQRLAPGLGQS